MGERIQYRFDRYVNGRKMAEGITVYTLNYKDAFREAQKLVKKNEGANTELILNQRGKQRFRRVKNG